MNIEKSVALVTGANRGLGRAYVEELLKRGASKIYVAARDRSSLEDLLKSGSGRLVPLLLDVTDPSQVAAAASVATDVTLLINNAGYAAFEGGISAGGMDQARLEMEVNYFGPLAMTRAFAPILAKSKGVVMNMLSMMAFVSFPMAATYAASKAAGLSLNRSIRAELAAEGIQVIGVIAVQADTAMGAKLPEPRVSPEELVSDALDAVQAGINDEVVAGEQSRGIYQAFTADPKGLQAKMLSKLPARA